jgi:hypothetical protein
MMCAAVLGVGEDVTRLWDVSLVLMSPSKKEGDSDGVQVELEAIVFS